MITLAIDIGSEFVDLAILTGGALRAAKYPVMEADPATAIVSALDAAAAEAGFDLADVGEVRIGSTGAINALLARTGARVALLGTEGFGDTLFLGRQNRRALYDPVAESATPAFLVSRADVFEVTGRIDAVGREVAPLGEAGLDAIVAGLRAGGYDAVAVCFLFAHLDGQH